MARSVLLPRPYLKGVQFVVRTDHHALKWIINLVDATGKLAQCKYDYQNWTSKSFMATGRIHQAANDLLMLSIDIGDGTLLDNNVQTMLIANKSEPDTPNVCHCFTCKRGGFIELSLPLVATLVKTSSYAQPQMLVKIIKTQSIDVYSKQAAATAGIPGSTFSVYRSGI